MATDEVGDAMLGAEALDVAEDVALVWLSAVACVELCASTATSMNMSAAARASIVDMVDVCVLRCRFPVECNEKLYTVISEEARD